MCDPPYWIADIRLRYTIWEIDQAESLNLKIHVYSLMNFATMLYACWSISISFFEAAILDFRLQLASHSMGNSFMNLSTFKTWDLFLKIFSYGVYRLRYKYFRFVSRHFVFLISACITYIVWRISSLNSFEHMSFAVGILQLCCICWDIVFFRFFKK